MNAVFPLGEYSRSAETSVRLLLDLLSNSYAVPGTSIERARRAAASDPRIDKVLLKLGLLDERAFAEAWSEVLGIRRIDALQLPNEPVLPELLSGRFLRNSEALPLHSDGSTLKVAVFDPLDDFTISAIASRTRLRVEPTIALASDLREAFDRLYPVDNAAVDSKTSVDVAASDLTRLRDLATDAPAILLVNAIIERAVELRASDVHLATGRNGTRLRYRVDGVLRDEEPPSPAMHDSIISRVKVLAELDITERRLPQDGRIRFGVAGREIDLRIATMPHLDGEGAVLRILDRTAVKLDLSSLGYSPELEASLERLLREPHGIFLVTGPTGSGKTTTLYAALRKIVRPELNVVSVEDPVEYHLDGVAQVQVQRKIGLTFPTALRAILRQDPDVIMIGEIRDSETAVIANQAALTGHFVLATLHTNSAAASFPRLIDMGLEPYLLSSTVRGAMAQRLIRLLCEHCAQPVSPENSFLLEQLDQLASHFSCSYVKEQIREPVGCDRCRGSGYKGRVAIAAIISSNDELRRAILRRADANEIEALYHQSGQSSMLRSGLEKVFAGQTNLAEVLRTTGGGASE